MQSPWRRWFALSSLLLGACVAGCNTPTLPLPPPSYSTVSLSSGQAIVVGEESDAEPNADVICFNRVTNLGRVTSANAKGAYELRIPAAAGDALECWQRVGDESSPSVSLTVPSEQ